MFLSPFIRFVSDPLDWRQEILWNPLDLNDPLLRLPTDMARILREDPFRLAQSEHAGLLDRKILFASESSAWDLARNVLQSHGKTDVLQLVVLVTSKCQLGCCDSSFGGYCGQTHGQEELHSKDVAIVLQRIESAFCDRPYKEISVGFFGGEPLLNVTFVCEVMNALSRWLTSRSAIMSLPIPKLRGSIISNGVLLSDETFVRLVRAGVTRWEITLDGIGQVHDSRRPFRSGRGSFGEIFSNLTQAALRIRDGAEVDFRIRCNVDSRNAGGVMELLNHLGESGLVPPMFFYIAPIRNWGKATARDSFGQREVFAEVELKVFDWQLRKGIEPDLLPQPISSTCMASKLLPSVLGADGAWYSCTETPLGSRSEKLYQIGSQRWIDLDKKAWHSALNSEIVPCPTCAHLPVCGGSCPKEWLEGSRACPPFTDNLSSRLSFAALSRSNWIPGLSLAVLSDREE